MSITSKERPILFSGLMARAIHDGSKTQTRRVVKPQMPLNCTIPSPWRDDFSIGGHDYRCPYGAPGDRLWVRETWGLCSPTDETLWFKGSLGGRTLEEMCLEWEIRYRSSYGSNQEAAHWRPSIFMPRWASRILLEVTDVRVQQLQDISEDDARAEGYTPRSPDYPVGWFHGLWDTINGAGAWHENPWVWAITFRRLQP